MKLKEYLPLSRCTTHRNVPSSLVLQLVRIAKRIMKSKFSLPFVLSLGISIRHLHRFSIFFDFSNASLPWPGTIFAWHGCCRTIVIHFVRLNSFFLLFTDPFRSFCCFTSTNVSRIHEPRERDERWRRRRMCICPLSIVFTKIEEFCILRGQIGNLFFCCIRNRFHCIFVILLLSFDNRHHSIYLLFAVSPSLSLSHHNLFSFQSVFCIVWHTTKRQRRQNVSIYIRRQSRQNVAFPILSFLSVCDAEITWPNFFLFHLLLLLMLLLLAALYSRERFYFNHFRCVTAVIKRWNLGFVPEEIHSTSLR